jgi:hypothetical protein
VLREIAACFNTVTYAETPLINIMCSLATVIPSSSGVNLDKTWSKVRSTTDLACTSLEVLMEPLESEERCGFERPMAEEINLFCSVGVALSQHVVKGNGGKALL